MKLTSSLKALSGVVNALLQSYKLLETQNAALRKENAELKNQHLSKEEEIVLLRYKNELAKTRIEAIISRLKAVDQSLTESKTETLPAFLTGQIQQHQAELAHTQQTEDREPIDTAATPQG